MNNFELQMKKKNVKEFSIYFRAFIVRSFMEWDMKL